MSGCGKARFAADSGAIAKKRNAATAVHVRPDVEEILTRGLSATTCHPAMERPDVVAITIQIFLE